MSFRHDFPLLRPIYNEWIGLDLLSPVRSPAPASTMMMASFQRRKPQDKAPVSHPVEQQSSSNKVDDSPREISIIRPPDGHTENTSSVGIPSYANPPFLPTEKPSNDLAKPHHHQQEQQEQQSLLYVSRSKRAAHVRPSEEEVEDDDDAEDEAAAAEARRKLRLSYIKTAARAIDEGETTPAFETTNTTASSTRTMADKMPTFPALPRNPDGVMGDNKPQTKPDLQPQKVAVDPPHRSPPATSLAAPVSPPLQAGPSPASPLSPSSVMPPPSSTTTTSATSNNNATTRDVATSVASAAAAVAMQQQHQQHHRGVPHVYHDFASIPDSVGYVRKKTGGVTQPFPEKLHELLEKESTPDFHENVQAIVGWLPHGRAFLVRKPKEFTRDIMPKYFRQTKLTSFQRQLNLYGFRRITQGTDAGAYYHELFLRGRPQLCLRMVRQKVKGTGHKQPADAQTEPNFYALPPTTGSAANSPAIPQPLAPASPPPRPTSPPVAVSSRPSIMDEMSPGTAGVHGAASLLKGLAAGVAPSKLSSINPHSAVPFLGPPAETFDGSKTKAIGSPMASTTQSFRMLTTYKLNNDKDEAKDSQREQGQTAFPSAPPPRSSYSSLLWGGGAPAPSPPAQVPAPSPAPAASFLWPHANPTRGRLESEAPKGDKKAEDPPEAGQEAV